MIESIVFSSKPLFLDSLKLFFGPVTNDLIVLLEAQEFKACLFSFQFPDMRAVSYDWCINKGGSLAFAPFIIISS